MDLGKELLAILEFFEASAAEGGVRLEVSAPTEVVAHLDRSLFQRAIGNLVANSLAHTPPGGVITLTASREADGVRVEVLDTGSGIAANHLPNVFDRFYRVDRARSKNEGGVGLGLAIVKSIATLHGGSAHVKSEVGRGTRVTLVFPGNGIGNGAVPRTV